MRRRFCFFAIMIFLWASELIADVQGDRIASQYYGLKKSDDSYSMASITISDKSGAKSRLKFEIFDKQFTEGRGALVCFIEPSEIAGMKFLTVPRAQGFSEQWVYLPALKIRRQIVTSHRNDDFVGSDLSYYDMDNHSFEESTYTFLKEEGLPGQEFDGMRFSKIEMRPHSPQAPYSKTIGWINQDDHFLYKLEVFDKKDQALWKTFTFQAAKQKGVLVPVKTMVINHKRGGSTIIDLTDVKINMGIKSSLFSVDSLKDEQKKQGLIEKSR